MRLLLNPKAEAEWFDHHETGARFKVRPVAPDQYDKIRRACLRKDGTLDVAKWGGEFADAAIEDWEGIGDSDSDTPAECNDKNRRMFGRNQAVNIMPWIIEQATSLDRYRIEEEDAAKKD